MTKLLKDYTKQDLIEMALTEPGTISNCYSLFHNYSSNNAWYLAMQQRWKGLDVTPVMSSSAWVKNGYITEETRRQIKKIWAMVPQQWSKDKLDKNGQVIKNEKGEVEKIYGTSFPLRQAFISWSMIPANKRLKDFKPNYTVDFKAGLERLGLTEIEYGMVDGNCQGYCIPKDKVVAINPVAENAQKTMLHEIAHCLLHNTEDMLIDRTELTRSIREAEAECTAYVCSIMLGCDDETSLSYSRGYIQHWLANGSKEFGDVNIKRVCKAVDVIMKALANYKDNYNKDELAKDLKALNEIK